MNIIMLLMWSLGRGNPVVPSRWQATFLDTVGVTGSSDHLGVKPGCQLTLGKALRRQSVPRGAALIVRVICG
jgi:hypothetical protein